MVNHPQESRIRRPLVLMMTYLIRAYRYFVSPWVGNQCRFYPSCSYYSEQALGRFGFFKGCYLTLRRLLKCHPWHVGGEDPVPTTGSTSLINSVGKMRPKKLLKKELIKKN